MVLRVQPAPAFGQRGLHPLALLDVQKRGDRAFRGRCRPEKPGAHPQRASVRPKQPAVARCVRYERARCPGRRALLGTRGDQMIVRVEQVQHAPGGHGVHGIHRSRCAEPGLQFSGQHSDLALIVKLDEADVRRFDDSFEASRLLLLPQRVPDQRRPVEGCAKSGRECQLHRFEDAAGVAGQPDRCGRQHHGRHKRGDHHGLRRQKHGEQRRRDPEHRVRAAVGHPCRPSQDRDDDDGIVTDPVFGKRHRQQPVREQRHGAEAREHRRDISEQTGIGGRQCDVESDAAGGKCQKDVGRENSYGCGGGYSVRGFMHSSISGTRGRSRPSVPLRHRSTANGSVCDVHRPTNLLS